MDFDAAWCPNCEQQIAPKVYLVPDEESAPAHAPPPPPSSPQSDTDRTKPAARRTKNPRARSGLVQGTGRLRPNGTIRRTDSAPKPIQPPPAPVKYKTVIDQSPIGLYCSDECRMADLKKHSGRPVNPTSDARTVSAQSDASSDDLSDASSSQASSSSRASTKPDYSHHSASIQKMAQTYGWDLPTGPAPVDEKEVFIAPEYTSGTIMAGRRLQQLFHKPTPKKSYLPTYGQPEPYKPIPGYTDGSSAWRDELYNMRSPSDRNRTITPATCRVMAQSSTASHCPVPIVPSDEELLNKYSESFRRVDSRASLSRSQGSASPSSARSSSSRRERDLVHPAAAGKLCVPDVKLKVNSSSSSISSACSSRPSIRSPLSESASSLPKRPVQESRSWSYDNVKTYDMMPIPLPTKTVKELHIIDGAEVEVSVKITQPLKRLFLFPTPSALS